jgi:beta-phosphoglucomutase-like phosphatase (HAD superfamily)
MQRPIKVGFDLDGVLLENPIRIFRPWIATLKKLLGKTSKEPTFYVPKTKLEEWLWALLHKTSYKIAPGLDILQELIKSGRVEAYIITARYKSLEKDFNKEIEHLEKLVNFKHIQLNKSNTQPHKYKEEHVKHLELDYFIDDNWDIAEHLDKQLGTTKKIFWLTNMFDKGIPYKYKVHNLKEFLQYLQKTYGNN